MLQSYSTDLFVGPAFVHLFYVFSLSCNGLDGEGSLGEMFVSTDYQVRVFGKSVILDIPYESLSIRTITMFGCMDR